MPSKLLALHTGLLVFINLKNVNISSVIPDISKNQRLGAAVQETTFRSSSSILVIHHTKLNQPVVI